MLRTAVAHVDGTKLVGEQAPKGLSCCLSSYRACTKTVADLHNSQAKQGNPARCELHLQFCHACFSYAVLKHSPSEVDARGVNKEQAGPAIAQAMATLEPAGIGS